MSDTITRKEVERFLALREIVAQHQAALDRKQKELLHRKRLGAVLEPALETWVRQFARRMKLGRKASPVFVQAGR